MRLRTLIATFIPATVLATALTIAAPASAHDALASATPAADTTISGDLDTVTLTFSEQPLAGLESGLVISVTGPNGAEVTTGTLEVDGSTLTKSVNVTAPGTYNLAWRSVSVDGHPISGGYQFTSTGSTASATPTASAAPSAPAASASPTAPATVSAQDGGRDTSPAIWALGGLTGLFVLAIVGILLITRRRPKAPE
ncbi:copper resistance protein CopC [Curtobacterium flaccumfaciens]|uniref:copper resistance CopC family protein n=1 Tax=Curtobacterium flaccumfaciens TaxID=2035 RepID=UPI00265A4097|nr:copper resistance CopC family protein [Curtobacterium flaccumfaciens]MCS5521466.1 copper resistance protein CopC [Curtobacterium flaccumfaciens pv. oortii]